MKRRSHLVVAAVLAVSVAALAGGCGDPGGVRGAGPTPTADGPTHLWPNLPPASSPAEDYGAIESVTVDDVTVPGGDLHKVDPVKVVRADFVAHPGTYSRGDTAYEKTLQQLEECGESAEKGGGGGSCPLLKAYYRDLTGDGKDDLIVGVHMANDELDIRVYAMEQGKLTQIMEMGDAVIGVELAGRQLIVRAVSSLPGYEYRTSWSWDAHQKTMLPANDEIVRSKSAPPSGTPVPSSESPSPAESPSPSAGGGQ
ncbi:hypothetical protein [Streptomyces sp. NPDC059009]|uniref:hypothetical protein n=1 Tax=Streptomyces sp. NPDC059009 TaxID=3346694 RepID=UPI0036A5AAA0